MNWQVLLTSLVLFIPGILRAEESFVRHERPEVLGKCTGLLYKAKKDNVPVYYEADLSSGVLSRLSAGELVCYVGEQGEFAVLHWQEGEANSKDSKLAYARLVDLWPSNQTQQATQLSPFKQHPPNVLNTLKSYYYYVQSGGVPEDGLAPYRPLINIFKFKHEKVQEQKTTGCYPSSTSGCQP